MRSQNLMFWSILWLGYDANAVHERVNQQKFWAISSPALILNTNSNLLMFVLRLTLGSVHKKTLQEVEQHLLPLCRNSTNVLEWCSLTERNGEPHIVRRCQHWYLLLRIKNLKLKKKNNNKRKKRTNGKQMLHTGSVVRYCWVVRSLSASIIRNLLVPAAHPFNYLVTSQHLLLIDGSFMRDFIKKNCICDLIN